MHEGLLELNQLWAPPERLPLSRWAEKHFVLSPEYSAKSGLIELEPGQAEIFDAFTDSSVEEIVLMVATQMVKTLFLQVSAAYAICEDPGPILFVGYKDDDAEKMSKERFAPMIRDIDPLRARVSPPKSRDANNTIHHKRFPGGTIDFVGSIAPANLARRTIRYLLCDEVDKYDKSSGDEGDAISLGMKRTARFGSRRKIILTCSPTLKGQSRIESSYEASDQRKPYIACHQCGHYQILRWNQVIFDSSLSPAEAGVGARYKCENCAALWTDAQRKANIRASWQWRPHRPFDKRAGFWLSHLYSTLALHSLAELTREFLTVCHDPERHKVFKNTDLAELWEEAGERPAWEKVRDRAEPYEIGPRAAVPAPVVAIMQGVDVQAKRLEIQTLGFGPELPADDMSAEEDFTPEVVCYVLGYETIELFESDGQGKMTSAPEYWADLAKVLDRRYRHSGSPEAELPVIAMAIDVGYNPDPVYAFSKRYGRQPSYGPQGLVINDPKTVLCVRGYDTEHLNAIHRVTERETARIRQGPGKDLPIITLGTGYLKTELYYDLHRTAPRTHFSERLAVEYFKGLTAEKKVVSVKGVISWEKIYPRNEPLDNYCYARGAYAAFGYDSITRRMWSALRKRFRIPEPQSKGKPVVHATRPTTVLSPYLD